MFRKYICVCLALIMLLAFCSCAGEAVFTNEYTRSKAISSFSLGKAALTPDEKQKAAIQYKPLGGAVSLELRDESGSTWRLDIPENALPYAETITMQLAGSVKTDILSGQLQNGIILQPEGLQFTKPATLSVTGAKECTCLLSGSGEGEKINFFPSKVADNKVKAEIWHFSSYIVYTPASEQQFQEAKALAEEAYKKILAEVKGFLKTPVSLPQLAPDYDFRCKEEDGSAASWIRNRALDLYIETVLAPENQLISELMGAGREVAVLGGEQDALYYAGLLVKRNFRKVDKLISTYKNDENKLIPVMNLTFAVIRQASGVGLDIQTGGYLEALSGWMARAADKQIKKIREEHDYKSLGPVLALIEGSLILNSDFKLSKEFSEKYLQKVKDAMSFTVHYDVSLFSGGADTRMKLEGEVKLSWLDEQNQKVFTGKGQGKYLSYTHSGPWKTTIDFPNAYPVEMKFLDFSPCTSKTVDVQVDKIGADIEVWKVPKVDEKSTDEYSYVNFMADTLLKEYKNDSGKFVFKLPFKNKSSIMGKKSFTKSETVNYPEDGPAAGSITYTIEIRHTPK